MNEMTEAQIYEAMGMEIPEGENEQEPAEPAAEETAQTTPAESDDAGQEERPEEEPEDKKPEQTAEERHRNAARRREKETKEAVDRAVEEALRTEREKSAAEMRDFFGKAGLKNSITGEKIESMEDFRKWKESYDAEKRQKNLRDGKLTEEDVAEIIGKNPAIQKANELIRDMEERQRTERERTAKGRIDAEIAEIGKLDTSIKSVEDLRNMEDAEEFRGYVEKGLSFVDAFYLTRREKLAAAERERGKAQAANLTRGKDHLRGGAAGVGTGSVTVPREEMEVFRAMNPGASESEIQKFYNDYRQKSGK